jgi:hypothetical protein
VIYLLTAGGVTPIYPTKIPFHQKASLMKEGDDMFGDLVRPAQKMGITIVARTDSQACLNDAAVAHVPDVDQSWFSRRSLWSTTFSVPYPATASSEPRISPGW